MNTEDKLKAICNYSHRDMATPRAQMISYIEFDTYDTQKKKQAKRNLLINELLDIVRNRKIPVTKRGSI